MSYLGSFRSDLDISIGYYPTHLILDVSRRISLTFMVEVIFGMRHAHELLFS
jgi:hypothetical protein